MNKLNFLKPDIKNMTTYLYTGSFLFFISLFDVFLSSFFKINITSFLPNFISFLLPFALGIIGLHLIRIEFSGIKNLDLLNKKINTNTFNAILTLLIIFVIIKSIPGVLSWFIIDANIAGDTKEACTGTGACWTYIKIWLNRFIYGMYPNELQWRINISFILLISLAFVGLIPSEKIKKFLTLYYVVIYPIIAFILIYYLISGGSLGLEWVETGAWGGLSLTFIVSFFCLIFCFPVGMFLALGRRSVLPTVRYFSVGFIEFWRGVPLITVLFMSSVMFPMFLPEDFFMDKLVRVIIAISLFEAAYVAEVIRGGLQALPRGQYDAAKSIGMGYWKMHLFVILAPSFKISYTGYCQYILGFN